MDDQTRRGLVGIAIALLSFGIGLAVAAAFLSPDTAGERAAQFQALAAAASLVASVVLIVVTAQYVRLTGDIASETRDARLDALRPALVLELEPIGALHTVFSLVNAGQGTAVDVDVTITFHPRDADKADHSVRWRAPSLAPGSHAQFMPESQMNTDVIVNAYSHVTVEGETKDVAGRVHPVKVLVDDLPGWNALVVTAHQRAEPDQLKRIADAVSKLAK